ncbi:MAG TPA: hypothetical protein VN759_04565 [Pseudolysinimonas sp.]|nr:hypothetical protein [Pseudolysinimonas sp.]
MPLAVRIVGRLAGGLAIFGALVFVILIVLLIVGGAGEGHSIADTPIGRFSLEVALPVFAVAIVLSVLLALLNAIGIRPWFDSDTGRFVRPAGGRQWALRLGGLIAGLLIPVTFIVVGIAVVVAATSDDEDSAGPILVGLLVGGLGAAIGVAGMAGGIAVMGWFGIVPGLLLGAGAIGVAVGATSSEPVALVAGVLATALAVAAYYGGARAKGTIPASAGSFASGGGALVLGIAFLVLAGIRRDPALLVGGVAGVAATVGYLVGGILTRRAPGAIPRD